MATPFGHALAGYAVFSTAENRGLKKFQLMFLCVFSAVAPDLDILPGILVGKPVLFHGSITHSIGFGVLLSLALAGGYYLLQRKAFLPVFGLCLMAFVTHLMLDYVGRDGRPPYGIPIFWPLSNQHFLSPIPLLLGARHVSSTSASIIEFIQGVFHYYNLLAIGLEVLIIGPFIWLGKWYSRKSTQGSVSTSTHLSPERNEVTGIQGLNNG